MKESALKKEFNKRDVQRMRNLITGNSGNATQVQSGWEKYVKKREEGDIWEELGKVWTIKSGIKQTVTKMDSIKKLITMPLTCPQCGEAMKISEYNKATYASHKVCIDCYTKMEDDLKIKGVYEDYMNERVKADTESMAKDLEQALDAWYMSTESFLNEQGDVENWSGGNKQEMYDIAKRELSKIKNT